MAELNQAPTGYDRVCKVIGEEMDKAWTTILQKLAVNNIAEVAPTALTESDVYEFFSVLNAAQMSIDFLCKGYAGQGARFSAHEVQVQPSNLPSPEGEVTVSIGVGVKW